jgi:DNA-binding transcriptional LysR family regulator
MDVRQLEYVVAIAETRNFTKAAERCHTAQSALSHQIARLEAQLGTKLFERTSRSVRLTVAGETLLPFARRILDELANAHAELERLGGTVRGRLRIGMTQTATRAFDLVGVLGDFGRKFPDVEVSVVMGPGFELLAGLHADDLDLAFAADPGVIPSGVAYRSFGPPDPLVAVASDDHPLARRSSVGLEELAGNSRFIEFRAGTELRARVDALFAAAGIQRRIAFELGQVSEMVRFAAGGLGVAIVPRTFTEEVPNSPGPPDGIAALELSAPGAHLELGVFTTPTPSGAARAFAELFDISRHVASEMTSSLPLSS